MVVGVEEKRDRKDPKIKLKIPDPVNVPGLKPKDWEASASDAVRSRTRPGLVPEAEALEILNHPDGYVVLLVRVEESLEAPHEVHATCTPEILVWRGGNTESAGLDDVERMIYRRDRVRGVDLEPLVPEFFEGGIGTEKVLRCVVPGLSADGGDRAAPEEGGRSAPRFLGGAGQEDLAPRVQSLHD